ncbi:rho GTPase-activating protein 32-like [Tympanuchus pallidicinctus]|uniref:rho GTPase-activating protein 32-like n=1 Tax=Tympanuchus pallidicinctus TaxID=109042 RepID=UPI002286F6E4|nr:rho GTPase-activating protein 32-like [Tympanuchus pallidicinctus]
MCKPKRDKEKFVTVIMMFCKQVKLGERHSSLSGPQSVRASSAATELLSLEEAQARRRGHSSSPVTVTQSRDIEVEEGPTAVRGKFHTVIDFPPERPSPASRMKESPSGCWCSCFSLGKPSSVAKGQRQHHPREPSETDVVVLAGDSSSCQPRCARASSEAGLCASSNGELLGSTNGCGSADSLPHNNSDGHEELIEVEALVSPGCAEDADLSPPDTTGTSLDCDPVPLQCSPAQAQPECPDSSTSVQEQVSTSEEKLSLLEEDLDSGLQSQALGSSTESSEPLSP